MTIRYLPLEDMRELWLWGVWKEPTPPRFSTTVLVVCTSREACRRYRRVQTDDEWLAYEVDDSPTERVPAPTKVAPVSRDNEIFDDGHSGVAASRRRFRLVSFDEFIEEAQRELQLLRTYGLTLLVNPGRDSAGELEADAMLATEEFLREVDQRRSSFRR